MTSEIKQRIEQVRKGNVPKGYVRRKLIGIAPQSWRVGKCLMYCTTNSAPSQNQPNHIGV